MKDWLKENKKPDGNQYNIYVDGLKIYTTIDSRMQQYAEDAVYSHISSLQDDFFNHWKGYTNAPFPKEFDKNQIYAILEQGMRRSDRYKKLKRKNISKKEINSIFRTKKPMRVFTWKGEKDTIMTPLDSVRYKVFHSFRFDEYGSQHWTCKGLCRGHQL